jgi:hypothetical protein
MRNLLLISIVCLLGFNVFANTERTEAILIGHDHTRHHWECKSANTTASCDAGYSSYYSVGNYIGTAYKWGGFDTIEQYDQKLADGYGAGSYASDGVLWCVTGVDCSGYVSIAWEQTTKYGTSTIHQISSGIDLADIKRGDAYNKAGSHIVMHIYTAHDGSPVIMEAAGGSFRKAVFRKVTWSYLNDYVPIRYNNIIDDYPDGTKDNPIIIDSFPYTNNNNTRIAISKEFHSYSADPGKMELGPEIIYKFETAIGGMVSISVTDVQSEGIDSDVHLLNSLAVNGEGMALDCKARADKEIEEYIEAGTWFIIVDSFTNSSGVDFPGEYTLSVDFIPDEINEEPDERDDDTGEEHNDENEPENDSDVKEYPDDDESVETPDEKDNEQQDKNEKTENDDENGTNQPDEDNSDEASDVSDHKMSKSSKGCSAVLIN